MSNSNPDTQRGSDSSQPLKTTTGQISYVRVENGFRARATAVFHADGSYDFYLSDGWEFDVSYEPVSDEVAHARRLLEDSQANERNNLYDVDARLEDELAYEAVTGPNVVFDALRLLDELIDCDRIAGRERAAQLRNVGKSLVDEWSPMKRRIVDFVAGVHVLESEFQAAEPAGT